MKNEIEELLEEIKTKIDYLLSDKSLNFGKCLEAKSMKVRAENLYESSKESKTYDAIISELRQINTNLNIIVVEHNIENTITVEA